MTLLKKLSSPLLLIFDGFNLFPKGLKHLMVFDFISSFIHFSISASLPIMMYCSLDDGGFNKFGYAALEDAAPLLASRKIWASIICICLSVVSMFIQPSKLLFISSIAYLIEAIGFIFVGQNIFIFLITFSLSRAAVVTHRVGFIRIIDSFCKKKEFEDKVDIRTKAFIQYYVMMNLAALLSKGSIGYIREAIGLNNVKIYFIIMSIIALLYNVYLLKYDSKNILGKNANLVSDKEVDYLFVKSGRLTKHSASLAFSLILISSIAFSVLTTPTIKEIIIVGLIFTTVLTIINYISGKELKQKYSEIKSGGVINVILVLLGVSLVYKTVITFCMIDDMPMTKWLDTETNRTLLGGHTIPAEALGSMNPLIILLLGGPIAKLITHLKEKKILKGIQELAFGIGILVIASFAILFTHWEYIAKGQNTLLFPALFVLFYSLGEVVCSPISYSYKALVVKQQYLGLVEAIDLILSGVGAILYTAIPHRSYETKNLFPTFLLLLIVSLITFSYLMIISPIVSKFIEEKKNEKSIEEGLKNKDKSFSKNMSCEKKNEEFVSVSNLNDEKHVNFNNSDKTKLFKNKVKTEDLLNKKVDNDQVINSENNNSNPSNNDKK